MPFITHSGSKQFIVSHGQKFAVDNLKNVEPGSIIELPVLLAFGEDKNISKLEVKVIGHAKAPKIRVVKFKSKSNYHKQYGFRAFQTVLEVVSGTAQPSVKLEVEDKIEKKSSETKPKTTKAKAVKVK